MEAYSGKETESRVEELGSKSGRVADNLVEDDLARYGRRPEAGPAHARRPLRRPDLTRRRSGFTFVREYVTPYAPRQVSLLVVVVLHRRRIPLVIGAVLTGRR